MALGVIEADVDRDAVRLWLCDLDAVPVALLLGCIPLDCETLALTDCDAVILDDGVDEVLWLCEMVTLGLIDGVGEVWPDPVPEKLDD